jgi:TldD protein
MSELRLPKEMAQLRPKLGGVIAQGVAKAPYFAALLSTKTGLRIQVDNNEQRIAEQLPSAGTVLTGFDGKTVYEKAVSGFALPEVQKAAKELLGSAQFDLSFKPKEVPDYRGDFITPMEVDPLELSIQDKLDRVRAFQDKVKKFDQRIVNARAVYIDTNEYSVFANVKADMAQRVQRMRLMAIIFVAGSDGQVRYDRIAKSGTGGWELLSFDDAEIQEGVKAAVDLLTAERIEPGEYTAISFPGVTGTIAHESFGHGVETDMFVKERAKAAHFVGKEVASKLVGIAEDPSVPGAYGSYFFDDEGQLSDTTMIVDKGIFQRGISDMYSASVLGIPRSANGRREDFSRKAYARMSNTFFTGGDSTVEDMIAQVDYGVTLDQWSSGMEDPQGWGIQVTCHYGHEIKGGKLTGKVFAPVVISGYVPEVLKSVSAVGKDVVFDAGVCGKGNKELIPVCSGGPHLLLRAPLG